MPAANSTNPACTEYPLRVATFALCFMHFAIQIYRYDTLRIFAGLNQRLWFTLALIPPKKTPSAANRQA